MQITVKRTGGIAGVNEQLGPVDTEELDQDVAREITSLVETIGFFQLPASLPGGRGFDLFYYRVTVRADDNEHSVSFDDSTPEADRAGLGDLLRALGDAGFEYKPKEAAHD